MEQAERIRSERERLNWSLNRLAREAGVSAETVRKAETGRPVLPSNLMCINAALMYGYGSQHK